MAQQLSRFAGETIVIADDEYVIVELSRMLLEKRGFKVLTAQNGQQCVELVRDHHPAMVLLDYMMPVMNGYEALTWIRAGFPDSYVLMFTGKGSEEVAVQLMKAGAADYLQKPFANQSLLDRIDAVLTLRQIEIENKRLLQEREKLQEEIQRWNQELEKRVEEKTQALERAHQEIVQAEKLALFGHITAGLAHEIRNPLNSINLFAQILHGEEGMNEEQLSYLTKISQEVIRIDEILVRMLAASQSHVEKREQVCFVKLLDKVLRVNADHLCVQNVDVSLDVDEEMPTLKADPLEMEQIFSNLITNSLQVMPDGGTLKIVLKADMEKIYIQIGDSGPGIPAENLTRIFDPFFTTREQGTGFGLSVVKRIIKSYGGGVKAESVPGEGALFKIEIPLIYGAFH